MRWLGILLLIIAWALSPTMVMAATSDSVTVTVSGWVVEAPGGFTLTYISDYEVGITWTKPATANNTMVRAKYSGYPEDRTDGYLIYYGTGTSASDTAVNLDETATPVYYRAWSENTTGVWSPQFAEANIEGVGVTLLALILFCGILSFLSLRTISVLLAVGASGSWLAVMSFIVAYPPGNMDAGETPHQMLIVVFFAVATAVLISGIVRSRRSREGTPEYEGAGYSPPSGKEPTQITGASVRQTRSSRHGWGGDFAEDPEEYQARIHKLLSRRDRRR